MLQSLYTFQVTQNSLTVAMVHALDSEKYFADSYHGNIMDLNGHDLELFNRFSRRYQININVQEEYQKLNDYEKRMAENVKKMPNSIYLTKNASIKMSSIGYHQTNPHPAFLNQKLSNCIMVPKKEVFKKINKKTLLQRHKEEKKKAAHPLKLSNIGKNSGSNLPPANKNLMVHEIYQNKKLFIDTFTPAARIVYAPLGGGKIKQIKEVKPSTLLQPKRSTTSLLRGKARHILKELPTIPSPAKIQKPKVVAKSETEINEIMSKTPQKKFIEPLNIPYASKKMLVEAKHEIDHILQMVDVEQKPIFEKQVLERALTCPPEIPYYWKPVPKKSAVKTVDARVQLKLETSKEPVKVKTPTRTKFVSSMTSVTSFFSQTSITSLEKKQVSDLKHNNSAAESASRFPGTLELANHGSTLPKSGSLSFFEKQKLKSDKKESFFDVPSLKKLSRQQSTLQHASYRKLGRVEAVSNSSASKIIQRRRGIPVKRQITAWQIAESISKSPSGLHYLHRSGNISDNESEVDNSEAEEESVDEKEENEEDVQLPDYVEFMATGIIQRLVDDAFPDFYAEVEKEREFKRAEQDKAFQEEIRLKMEEKMEKGKNEIAKPVTPKADDEYYYLRDEKGFLRPKNEMYENQKKVVFVRKPPPEILPYTPPVAEPKILAQWTSKDYIRMYDRSLTNDAEREKQPAVKVLDRKRWTTDPIDRENRTVDVFKTTKISSRLSAIKEDIVSTVRRERSLSLQARPAESIVLRRVRSRTVSTMEESASRYVPNAYIQNPFLTQRYHSYLF